MEEMERGEKGDILTNSLENSSVSSTVNEHASHLEPEGLSARSSLASLARTEFFFFALLLLFTSCRHLRRIASRRRDSQKSVCRRTNDRSVPA